jgi:hypothetical protein
MMKNQEEGKNMIRLITALTTTTISTITTTGTTTTATTNNNNSNTNFRMIPSQSHKLIQVVVQNNMKYNP